MAEIERSILTVLLASADPSKWNIYDELISQVKRAEKTVSWSQYKPYYGTDVISFNWDTFPEISTEGVAMAARYPGDPWPGRSYLATPKPHGSTNLEARLTAGCAREALTHRNEVNELYGETAWTPGHSGFVCH